MLEKTFFLDLPDFINLALDPVQVLSFLTVPLNRLYVQLRLHLISELIHPPTLSLTQTNLLFATRVYTLEALFMDLGHISLLLLHLVCNALYIGCLSLRALTYQRRQNL